MTDESIVETVAATEVPVEQPKTLTVEQVNAIVRREKAQAIEKGRREAEAQYKAELEAYQSAKPTVGGVQSGIDEEKLYRQFYDRLMVDAQKMREEEEQKAFQSEISKVADTYMQKMSVGPTLYEDFAQVTSEFDPAAFPQVVYLAANLENTPDVMYELAKNPQKLATIDYLAQRDPKAARAQLAKLSQSIKDNQQAKENNPATKPPLARIQPSATAGAASGDMSVADFKRMPWLRG